MLSVDFFLWLLVVHCSSVTLDAGTVTQINIKFSRNSTRRGQWRPSTGPTAPAKTPHPLPLLHLRDAVRGLDAAGNDQDEETAPGPTVDGDRTKKKPAITSRPTSEKSASSKPPAGVVGASAGVLHRSVPPVDATDCVAAKPRGLTDTTVALTAVLCASFSELENLLGRHLRPDIDHGHLEVDDAQQPPEPPSGSADCSTLENLVCGGTLHHLVLAADS